MSEKINICRAVTFCSNFIPANTKDKKWEYIAIGTIDGIIVSDNLIKDPTVPVAQSIWKEQKEFQRNLKGEYTAQQIFVIRYGREEKEQSFWNLDSKRQITRPQINLSAACCSNQQAGLLTMALMAPAVIVLYFHFHQAALVIL